MTAGRKVNTSSQSWCTSPKYVNTIKDFWGREVVTLHKISIAYGTDKA